MPICRRLRVQYRPLTKALETGPFGSQDSKTRARHRRNPIRGHRGISYRERVDKTRSYQVFWKGGYLPEGGLPTLKDAIAYQGSLKVAEAKECRRILDRRILPAWGSRRIGSFSPADLIARDRELRAEGLASGTIANILKPARAVFDFAVMKGYIATNPFTQVPRGRLSRSGGVRAHREWTREEVARLIAAGYEFDDRDTRRSEYGLVIELKLHSGARLRELLGARYGDFDFGEGLWNVRFQWTRDRRIDVPKTKKSIRRIPLAPDLLRKLAERKLRLGAGDEAFVFATRIGLPAAARQLAQARLGQGPSRTPA